MSDAVFTHDVFLADQALACAVAARWRAEGLRVWPGGGDFPVAASRQSAAFSSDAEEAQGEEVAAALPRPRYPHRLPANSLRLRFDPWAVACLNGTADTRTPTKP